MIKPMSDEEYLRQSPPRCPVCGSEDIIRCQDVEFGEGFITEPAQCEACGRWWEQIYTLTGFEMQP
jgi:predicted RNA-binding Zn-ribbon protein involved in translation (DUF1610 family)